MEAKKKLANPGEPPLTDVVAVLLHICPKNRGTPAEAATARKKNGKKFRKDFFIQIEFSIFAPLTNQNNNKMRTARPLTRKSITTEQFRNFIFAGRSIFTLENSESGNYITFKVKQIMKNYKPVPGQFAVECKALGDKYSGYKFLGFVNLTDRKFKRRCHDLNFMGYKTWVWLLKNLNRLESFEKLVIYHEGKCCKCGMPLTVPESIDSGIGPDCKKTMYSRSIQALKDLGTWNEMLTYEENVKLGLEANPSVWSNIIIPEGFRKDEDYIVHNMFEEWGIF